ncbi:MAG: glycerol-3-phosphate acyltransferase [Actinobacteria bacterium]|nr:MAG: glycerol-3-phosphate acyltransferase [Actinomycetota bacterium]
MAEAGILVLGFVLGGLPFSNLVAKRTRGVDLRDVGVGKVSTSALYRLAGTGPLLVAALADIAKGTVAPLLAGDRWVLAAFAGGVTVLGHNWSPFLRGAGGRGVAPALGALAVNGWPGTLFLLGGLGAGKAFRQSALGGFVAELLLTPFLAAVDGGRGALVGACMAVPLLVKRVAANGRPTTPGWRPYAERLLFDPGDEPPARP